MSNERFFMMLERAPRLKRFWDKDKKILDINAFEHALGVMSSSEMQIAKFFASVWINNNTKYGFDLVDALESIDENSTEIIVEWIENPFWP